MHVHIRRSTWGSVKSALNVVASCTLQSRQFFLSNDDRLVELLKYDLMVINYSVIIQWAPLPLVLGIHPKLNIYTYVSSMVYTNTCAYQYIYIYLYDFFYITSCKRSLRQYYILQHNSIILSSILFYTYISIPGGDPTLRNQCQ